jgi:RimJ/RimL family protein N-acetyltransferase
MHPSSRGCRREVRDEDLHLRPIGPEDLHALFEFQSDPESNQMAGTKPRSREVFLATWQGHFANPKINARVIEVGGEIVGSLACFEAEERDCVGYWLARAHWGRGIASRALAIFLRDERRRPLHATACSANAASLQILEKCGFRRVGVRMGEETERYLAREVVEFVLE